MKDAHFSNNNRLSEHTNSDDSEFKTNTNSTNQTDTPCNHPLSSAPQLRKLFLNPPVLAATASDKDLFVGSASCFLKITPEDADTLAVPFETRPETDDEPLPPPEEGINDIVANNLSIIATHSKSIRAAAFARGIAVCGSYDGEASLVHAATNNIVEHVEGVDTEIKGVALDAQWLAVATRGKTVWILESVKQPADGAGTVESNEGCAEPFEISKILEDHTQDVKGCCFYDSRLYSWSYDSTIKVYELFPVSGAWELVQSIELGSTVWTVCFFEGRLCAGLQSGEVAVLVRENRLWVEVLVDAEDGGSLERLEEAGEETGEDTCEEAEESSGVIGRLRLSVTPVFALCCVGPLLGAVCNRSCLVLLDSQLQIVWESGPVVSGWLYTCCFWPATRELVAGGDSGEVVLVKCEIGSSEAGEAEEKHC